MAALHALRRGLRRVLLDQPLVWRIVETVWPCTRILPRSVKMQLDRQVLQRLPKDEVRSMLLRRMPEAGVCAEIGVWKGDFSDKILRLTRPRELHLIDPWAFQPEFPRRMYSGNIAASQQDMDAIYRTVVERFAHCPNVHIHRRFSSELPDILGDQLLDWVYIDGNHSKDFVRQDLELTWRALRPGGYVTGDDYFWENLDESPGVREAVDEFSSRTGVGIDFVGGQFMMRKP